MSGSASPASPTPGGSSGPGGPSGPVPTPPAAGTPSAPGANPAPGDGERTIRGTVVAGVEAGCLLLNDGGVDYLLLGGDRTVIRPGATVSARGAVARGVMTTCMQGVPFQVAEVHPAP